MLCCSLSLFVVMSMNYFMHAFVMLMFVTLSCLDADSQQWVVVGRGFFSNATIRILFERIELSIYHHFVCVFECGSVQMSDFLMQFRRRVKIITYDGQQETK